MAIAGKNMTVVRPFENWVYSCSECYETNVMNVIGTTDPVTTTKQCCRKCGHEDEIELPENP